MRVRHHEPIQTFEHADTVERRILQQLLNRPFREAAFARQVKAAYDYRCAISGLSLRNGGGRPEVEAAHIRPVAAGGPDTVRNGLALSATVHWMFDRGLISVAEDHTILVSHNKVPREAADRLLVPERRILLPRDPRHHPHADYLRLSSRAHLRRPVSAHARVWLCDAPRPQLDFLPCLRRNGACG